MKNLTKATLAGGAALALAGGMAPSATADPVRPTPRREIVVDGGSHGYAAKITTMDVSQRRRSIDSANTRHTPVPRSHDQGLSPTNACGTIGNGDTVCAAGASWVTVPQIEDDATFNGSDSDVSVWTGDSCHKATSLTLQDTWGVGTWGAGLTVTVPAGMEISISSDHKTADFTTEVKDACASEHQVDTIKFSTSGFPVGGVTSIKQEVRSTVQFGTSFYQVSGEDSAIV